MQKHIQHNKDERKQFFRKIYLSLYWKGCVWEGVGDRTKTATYWSPNSSGYHSLSFPFSWAAQPGAWGPSLCWYMVLIPASYLRLIWTSCRRRYIIWFPPTSCVTIRTQFNPSTVKVAPWYLRPDASVIYTSAFLLLTAWLGRRSICNTIRPSKSLEKDSIFAWRPWLKPNAISWNKFNLKYFILFSVLFFIFTWFYRAIGLMNRVFTNGPGDREFNSRLDNTKDSKNGTWFCLA